MGKKNIEVNCLCLASHDHDSEAVRKREKTQTPFKKKRGGGAIHGSRRDLDMIWSQIQSSKQCVRQTAFSLVKV